MALKIMIMGASYGSLLASKILFGGHSVHLICLPAEADLINAEGFRVRMPIRGRKDPVEIDSRKLPGTVTAGGTTSANPADYDLIGLANDALSRKPALPTGPALVEPLHDDRRQHPENPAQKIRHPRNVRILPPSRDFH